MIRKNLSLLVLVSLVLIRCLFFTEFSIPLFTKFADVSNQTLAKPRRIMYDSVRHELPKVHADLLLGMTLGHEGIKENTRFYTALLDTSLVHVVVVSGFNISLVITAFTKVFYRRVGNGNRLFLFALLTFYVILCGAGPPVIRAAIMGYIGYLALGEGRGVESMRLLVVVCLLMLLIAPSNLESLSFWLSSLATLGLICLSSPVKEVAEACVNVLPTAIKKIIPVEDFATTVSCQLFVWPVISLFFGRMNFMSIVYNSMILWLVPLATIGGFVYLFFAQLFPPLSSILALLVFPFYDLFVRFVQLFSHISFGNIELEISVTAFVIYYVTLVGFTLLIKRH